MNEDIAKKIGSMMEEDQERGLYRVNRQAFTDEQIFEAEMKYIFEGNWIYAAHESQLEKANDFYTLYAGRQPVVLVRSKSGGIDGFINSCTHRGARLCRSRRGNKAVFTCTFHGWSFRSSGELLKVKKPEGSGYPECFNENEDFNLRKVPRVESYRGFIFISLSEDVLPLEEYLGSTKQIIDLMVDQSPQGCEILKGSSTYT